jgi:hypothetical protein
MVRGYGLDFKGLEYEGVVVHFENTEIKFWFLKRRRHVWVS